MRRPAVFVVPGLFLFAMFLAKANSMQEATQKISIHGMELVSVSYYSGYSIGLPVWVAVTVRAHGDTGFQQLAFAELANMKSCVGLEMSGPSVVHSKKPTPMFNRQFGPRPESLRPGETRRMLTDISPFVGSDIQEGEYRIALTYIAPSFSITSKPFNVRFRRPEPAEDVLLKLTYESRRRSNTWATWMLSCKGSAIQPAQIPSASPAALTFVLSYLFCGSEPMASIPPETLEVFKGIPVAERRALQAELLFQRNDMFEFGRLREEIMEEWPGLEWWLRDLIGGGGYLRAFSERPN